MCEPDLENPSRVASGLLDSDRIGPYARWQGNLNAPLMVVGQDFSDVATFERVQGWPGESIPTNLALVELLEAAGLSVRPPRQGDCEDVLFFTNAVLCLKRGGMQAPIRQQCFRACGERFLRPTVDLIAPRAVATLGLAALNAVLAAFAIPRVPRLGELLDQATTFPLSNGARVFPFAHPGRLGQGSRPLSLQRADWARLGGWLRAV